MKRVIIYEDNRQLRESIEGLLGMHDDFEVVGSYATSDKILDNVRALKPDLVLMDIHMGESNGIDSVRRLRYSGSNVPVIMLTVFEDGDNIFNALSAGASGYILKKHAAERLISSALEVLHGGGPMSPSVSALVLKSFHSHENALPDYRLTPREQEILASMSLGNSYKLIASEFGISIDTVRVHIKHIYEKLHVNSQTEAVSKAFREKLI
ncbi:MAG: response regulator transcription factor [Spirosomataceae bacterium]